MNRLLESKYPAVSPQADAVALHLLDLDDFDPVYMAEDRPNSGIFHVVFSVYAVLERTKKEFSKDYSTESHWTASHSMHGRFCCKARSIQRVSGDSERNLCLKSNMVLKDSVIMFLVVNPTYESHPYQTLPLFLPYVEYSAWCTAEDIKDELPLELDMRLLRWNSFSYTCNPGDYYIAPVDFVSAMFNCMRTKYAKQQNVLSKLTPAFCASFYHKDCKGIKEAKTAFITYSGVVELKKIIGKSKHFQSLRTACWNIDLVVDGGWAGGVMKHPGINSMFKMTEALTGGALRLEGAAFLIAASLNYRANPREPLPNFKVIPKMALFNLLLFVPEVFLDSALWTLMVLKTTGDLRRKLSQCTAVDRSVVRADVLNISYRLCGASPELAAYRHEFRSAFYRFVFDQLNIIYKDMSKQADALARSWNWRVVPCSASKIGAPYIVPDAICNEWPFLVPTAIDFGVVLDYDCARTLTTCPPIPSPEWGVQDEYFPFSRSESEMPTNAGKKYSSSELCFKISISRCALTELLIKLLMSYNVTVLECANTQAIINRDNHHALSDGKCIFVCPTEAHRVLLESAWHPIPVYTADQIISDPSISSTDITTPLVLLYAHFFSMHQLVLLLDAVLNTAVKLGKRSVEELELHHVRRCYIVGLFHYAMDSDGTFLDIFNQLTHLSRAPISILKCLLSSQASKAIRTITSVSDVINGDCNGLTSVGIVDILEKAKKRVSIKNMVDCSEYDGNMLALDAIFPIYLTKADTARVKHIFQSSANVVMTSATYGTFVKLGPRQSPLDVATPVCFCKYENSGIFGPALADLRSGRYFCHKIVPDSLMEKIPKVFCPRCSIPVDFSSSSSSSNSSMPASNEKLMAFDAAQMQLQIQFHPKYPSCSTPRQYMGCPTPRAMLIVGSYLPYEQLVAALDFTVDHLTIIHLQSKFSITRIPTTHRPSWLKSMAESYIHNADEVLSESNQIKITKVE